MNPLCPVREHVSRRAFLKASLSVGGAAVANWGGLFNSASLAAEAKKQGMRCILMWMNGGASQIDTFDMKPGRPTGGPFRPISSKVAGTQVCEYLPKLAQQTDKLAIIRSMVTSEPDHPGGITSMHIGYRPEVSIAHPELGAVIAKYHGKPDADLPTFIRMGPAGNGGPGFLGPEYQPFSIGRDGRLPPFSDAYATAESEKRRSDLLKLVEDGFTQENKADPYGAHRLAKEKAWRLLKSKGIFDVTKDWPKAKERYGDSEFGRGCFLARKLVEADVPFVEVGHDNYDSHADNFVCHKANMNQLDPAWSSLLIDLQERGLLEKTLVVWMGEVGRTPYINNRAGRDHYIRAWTIVLAGAGVKGGLTYGETDIDGKTVKDKPVTEGDLFATIYSALGISPRTKHMVGTRPITVAPERSTAVADILS
jgi:hypothetical protein